MKEQSVAKIYAKSFLEIGKEHGFDVADELTKLTIVINESNDLENVLFLDVFAPGEKKSVFEDIAAKMGLNKVLTTAINFLIEEKRVNILPLISKEVIVVDDHLKGFLRGTIQGSEVSIPADIKANLENYIQTKLGKKPILNYEQSNNVSAGYRVTVEDMQLDASVDNQLERFKESLISE